MIRSPVALTAALALTCLVPLLCQAAAPPSRSPASLIVDASQQIATVSADQLGTNLGIWYDVTTPSLPRQLATLHAHLLRWPGGSLAETYHWKSHTECSGRVSKPAYHPHSTFRNFMHDIVLPGHYDVAITVAYGTNAACTSGGRPTEAAAWVAYARAHGEASRIKFWTVGNETFGGWETDLHAHPHDPATYAAAMSGPNGYYALMKAADPKARVGVVVGGGGPYAGWDHYVLSHAPYDFVELHWYAQEPGKENDTYLLERAPGAFRAAIRTVRTELAAAGKPDTPILVGEVNSVSYNPGKQTVSIVNALFAGQVLTEGIAAGLAGDAWWFGDGGTQNCGHNNSPSLYGFQNWGSYDLIFGATAYDYNNCTSSAQGPIVPEGTLSPSGDAFRLVSQFARPGAHLLAVSSAAPELRAYAATWGSGYALLLFNLNGTTPESVHIVLRHAAGSHYVGTQSVYGKTQYDQSRENLWPGAVTHPLGRLGDAFALTLPPWSMSVVTLSP